MANTELLKQQSELAKQLEDEETNYGKDSKTRKTWEYMNRRLERIEAIITNFRQNHRRLLLTLDPASLGPDDAYFKIHNEIEEKYRSFKLKLEQFKSTLKQPAGISVENASVDDQANRQTGSSDEPEVQPSFKTTSLLQELPKLPPLQIPIFTGISNEWQRFSELFRAVIDSNPTLGSIQKMQYLLSYLQGEAKDAISHLQLSGNNYNSALQTLEDRFSNKKQAATMYIDAILEIKQVAFRSAADIIHLHNTIRNCTAGLNSLGYDTLTWGPIITRVVIKKLDNETHRLLEEALDNPKEFPSLHQLCSFLLRRYQLLTTMKTQPSPTQPQKKKSFSTTIAKATCPECNSSHNLYYCDKFKALPVYERQIFVKKMKICRNCLSHSESTKCKSKVRCLQCNKEHHTLLHNKNELNANIATDAINIQNTTVLLATATINALNREGKKITLRALIDPGSQTSFISLSAANKLGLQKRNILASITGIGGIQAANVRKSMTLQISPHFTSNFQLLIQAYILNSLTTLLPNTNNVNTKPEFLKGLKLADPHFDKSAGIDMILGADVFEEIIEPNIKRGNPLLAQKTKLGWIISGKAPINAQANNFMSNISIIDLHTSVQQFFDMDSKTEDHPSKTECEIIYQSTTTRGSDGKYSVMLPFKDDRKIPPLGESRNRALIRLKQLERRLEKDSNLRKAYNEVMQEYLDLGHMVPVLPYTGDDKFVYYLPHHPVIKSESTTTKVRVVFDASAKTASGSSLNDHLLTGPKIQEDLGQILLRWRKYEYVFSADIEKMFRMINIQPCHQNYQRVLWRPSKKSPILEHVLTTVSFGETPSSYLSIRTLHQLADDERQKYPIAALKLKQDYYVDNFLSGAETREEAITLQEEMINILKSGGFNLRKWSSNDQSLLNNIPEESRELGLREIAQDPSISALGLIWNPNTDDFRIKTVQFDATKKLTKRQILSNIATVYDPLQWLAPLTITAKILMQKIWQTGIDWDQSPSDDIQQKWKKIEEGLSYLENIRIPRWMNSSKDHAIELHGFCDASEAAYAAVIYSKVTNSRGDISVSLLCAKTRVTPLKSKITLPKLELNAALLLAELMNKTISAMGFLNVPIYCWSDSMIVLAWIQKDTSLLENYVGTRVTKIRNLSYSAWSWSHVKSKENPADCASRGINAQELLDHKLWWKGPLWLSLHQRPSEILTFSGITNELDHQFLNRFSNFTKLVNVAAYCMRFKTKLKGTISSSEYEHTRLIILRNLQQSEFAEQIADLSKNKPIGKRLRELNPFIDGLGLLRVGGRLRNANLDEDSKYPVLLPPSHHVTYLIIRQAHVATSHGTINDTRNYLRMRYWIVNDQKSIRHEIHRCLTCFKFATTKRSQQIMGDLPMVRVLPTHPFLHCGIDYAGPFKTRTSKGRSTNTVKGYVCLFVCMVTKAIHLELVSDMSTEAFLAAFKRFISRRGLCKEVFSDNGTNFVGANNQMDREMQQAIQMGSESIARISAKDGVSWKFIPVATPHFGGLWEAGIKSTKKHIKCIFEETKIIPTFEEFTTVLCQIEACLNSRPLVPLTSNPEDTDALTPGHFLVSRPLLALPEADKSNATLYDRWVQLSKIHQIFWKRWTTEYLHHLQKRTKWTAETPNLKTGQLVLVRERDTPPTKWPLARIKEVHPGSDGKVRTATVIYHGNHTKETGIVNLCKLPIDTPEEPQPATPVKTRSKLPIKRAVRNHNPSPKPQVVQQPRQQRNKKPRVAPCTWAKTLLNTMVLLLTFGAVFTQNISTEKYKISKPNIGYYVEKLGHANIVRGNLRMQVDFPIESIINDKTHVNSVWNQTKMICDTTQEMIKVTHCDNLLKHLTFKKTDLMRQIEEIMNIPTIAKRAKRGLLGKMLTAVFGVNDEIYSDIESLQNNQYTALQTMTQQNIQLNARMETRENTTTQRLDEFKVKLNQVIESMNSMNKWYAKIDRADLGTQVVSIYLTAVNYYDEIETKYNKLINALYGQGSILNFLDLISIRNTINDVSSKLGPHFKILQMPQNKITLLRSEQSIVVYGYFQIIENSIYDLLHVTSIPNKIDRGKYLIPQLHVPTVAVNFDEATYFELTEQELNSCRMQDEIYLCFPKSTNDINLIPNCIIDKVYHRPNTQACDPYLIENNSSTWKQLMAPNSWLYVVNNPTTVSVICDGRRNEISITDIGIIHTVDSCMIQVGGIGLRSTINELRKVVASFTSEILPTDWNITKAAQMNITPIARVSEQIFIPQPSSGETLMPLLHESRRHTSLMATTMSVSLVLTVILTIILVWHKFKICHSCRKETAQAQQDTDDIPLSRRLEQLIARPPACRNTST